MQVGSGKGTKLPHASSLPAIPCHPMPSLPAQPRMLWPGPQWVCISSLLRSGAFGPHAGVQGPQGVTEHPPTPCTIHCGSSGTPAYAPTEDHAGHYRTLPISRKLFGTPHSKGNMKEGEGRVFYLIFCVQDLTCN